MFPRRAGLSVVENTDITEEKVRHLTAAAENCWNAIMNKDLNAFAKAYRDSFNAQIAMFPGMIADGVQEYIDKYSQLDGVMAWKMPGAGGGGYLALVFESADKMPAEGIRLTIRRAGA